MFLSLEYENLFLKRSQHASPRHKMHFILQLIRKIKAPEIWKSKGKKCDQHTYLPLKFTSDYNKDPDVPLAWIKIQKH